MHGHEPGPDSCIPSWGRSWAQLTPSHLPRSRRGGAGQWGGARTDWDPPWQVSPTCAMGSLQHRHNNPIPGAELEQVGVWSQVTKRLCRISGALVLPCDSLWPPAVALSFLVMLPELQPPLGMSHSVRAKGATLGWSLPFLPTRKKQEGRYCVVVNTHTLLFKRSQFKSCFPGWPQAGSSLSGHRAPIQNDNSKSRSLADAPQKASLRPGLWKQLVFIIHVILLIPQRVWVSAQA